MMHSWEVFLETCDRSTGGLDGLTRAPADTADHALACAVGEAARVTTGYLRYGREWSLLNSHLLTARLVAAASAWWTAQGTEGTEALRLRLRRVCLRSQDLLVQEEERRSMTERVIAGTAPAPAPATAGSADDRAAATRRVSDTLA